MLIKASPRKLLLFSLGIVCGLVSFSQANYLQGYVIKNNGDTILGLIDYHNWENNPGKIAFKDAIKKPTIYFSANEIKEFHVSDEIYESAVIQIETSNRTLNTLDRNSDFQFGTDTGFVQTIIKGTRSLYYYKSSGYEPNFYILQNGKLELLLYKKYLVEIKGLSENQNLKFIQQLKTYLGDCPALFKQLDSLDYKKKSLEKAFVNYYKCTQNTASFHKKTERITTEFGIAAGITATKIKFTGDHFYERMINVNHQLSYTVSGGFFAEFILPRSQKKWSIYNELGYVSYKSNWKYGEITDPDYYTLYQGKLKYSYIRLVNMVKFKYPVGNTSLFVKVGLSNGFVVSEKNYQLKEAKFYGTPVITEGKLLDNRRAFEQGFVSAVGSQLKKIFIEARFEVSNGISTYPNLGSPVKRGSVQLGYRF